jgi:hypothetical protein
MGLVKQTLRTENPTVDPLTLDPDNLVDRTFLMPLRKMELESEPRSSSVSTKQGRHVR